MDIVAEHKQISQEEKVQINHQVKADLIDHLYQGCLPGTVTGIIASIVLFLNYYGYTPTHLLIIWLTAFNLMMLALSALFFLYIKFKDNLSLNSWEITYSIFMIGCAIAWVPSVLLMPVEVSRQYLALVALFLATTGYATGTIGQFRLCVITLCIMLIPLIAWSVLKGGIFYNILAGYSLIYMVFMIGINLRSTRWFKESLKLKLENTLVSYQANHDLLTDLPNQRMLPQFVDKAIQFSKEKNVQFALVCFSLNRMEIINDSMGLEVGNSITQSVAKRLTQFASQQSELHPDKQYIITISRKDTFNIIVIPYKAEDSLIELDNIFSILDEVFYLESKGIKLTASMGVSIYPIDGNNSASLLKNADAAMLKAKQFGGNRLEFYRSEINAQAPKRFEMENDLHQAIQHNQFLLVYQPLVDAKSGKIVGSEALIRWLHPVYGYISPMQFIPVAEETGLIIPIGKWVIEEACNQLKKWHQMGFNSLTVAVNVSEKQLRQENLLEILQSNLVVNDLKPNFLEIELTETAILDETAIPLIKQFKQMGLRLAVDDFGTGYSGLSYFKKFSIDKLKIDQSFIRDIPTNNDSITIVSAILAMAKELNVSSLAEGVETEAQLQFLKNKGCDYIQGYYFSKPLEPADFTQLLQKRNILSPVNS